jgi:hypothetical protein
LLQEAREWQGDAISTFLELLKLIDVRDPTILSKRI